MQTIPDLISKELRQLVGIKPLEEGETAEFRLVRAGVYDPTVGKPVSPQGHILAPIDMIKDTWDKEMTGEKMIENITGYLPIRERGKATQYQTLTEHVRFGHTGSLLLTSDQNNLYYYLKLHNKNRDNLNRKVKGVPVVFYEVNESKELEIKNNLFDYKIYAGTLLLEITDDQLRKLVRRLNDYNKTRQRIEFDLRGDFKKLSTEIKAYADGNPVDVIMASDDRRSQLRIVVDVAADNRWILFDADGGQWVWSLAKAKNKTGKASVICKVEDGNNPNRALVDYMLSNKEQGTIVATELFARYQENYSIPK